MKTDIVFPAGNEKEFILMASKLSYNKLVFLYDIFSGAKDFNDNVELGFFVNENALKNKSIFNIVNNIKRSNKKIFVRASNARVAIERIKPYAVFGLESFGGKDFMNQRASGLNHVLCKLAKQAGVKIAFSFSDVLKSSGVKRAKLLGRMKQNLKLCKKYGVDVIFGSFASSPYEMRNSKDIESFFGVL